MIQYIYGSRGSGKTTRLIEKCIEWASENDGPVLYYGAHSNWAKKLIGNLRREGLEIDLTFIHHLDNSALYGRGDHLLAIDDFHDMGPSAQLYVNAYIIQSGCDAIKVEGLDLDH